MPESGNRPDDFKSDGSPETRRKTASGLTIIERSPASSKRAASAFGTTIVELGAVRSFISAGRPQSIGCAERVQRTVLEERWKPAFARHLIPECTGLRRGLERYYDFERTHTGRWNRGRTPAEVVGKAKCYR